MSHLAQNLAYFTCFFAWHKVWDMRPLNQLIHQYNWIMIFATKFRAFQLDTPGSLFSYYKYNEYTLIEARLPIGGIDVLRTDLSFHGKPNIDVLHITSFDGDHCKYDDLIQILNHLRPNRIEIPHYKPESEDGLLCYNLLRGYERVHQEFVRNVIVYTKEYISSLTNASERGTNNVAYHSSYSCDNKNDMSLIKLFRSSGFNVLSVGDCESEDIANYLISSSFIGTEVDVLILANHGANNGFTTGKLLDYIKPKIAICSSNFGNHYDHPRPEVCSLLQYRNIPLLTTKRGDVLIYQIPGVDSYVAVNMAGNNEIEETRTGYTTKRYDSQIILNNPFLPQRGRIV